MPCYFCLVGYAKIILKKCLTKYVRKRIYEEQRDQIEQDMAPFGFINDGPDNGSFTDKDGDVWHLDEYGDKSYMWDYM